MESEHFVELAELFQLADQPEDINLTEILLSRKYRDSNKQRLDSLPSVKGSEPADYPGFPQMPSTPLRDFEGSLL